MITTIIKHLPAMLINHIHQITSKTIIFPDSLKKSLGYLKKNFSSMAKPCYASLHNSKLKTFTIILRNMMGHTHKVLASKNAADAAAAAATKTPKNINTNPTQVTPSQQQRPISPHSNPHNAPLNTAIPTFTRNPAKENSTVERIKEYRPDLFCKNRFNIEEKQEFTESKSKDNNTPPYHPKKLNESALNSHNNGSTISNNPMLPTQPPSLTKDDTISYHENKERALAIYKPQSTSQPDLSTPQCFFVDQDGVAHNEQSKSLKNKSGKIFDTFLNEYTRIRQWSTDFLISEARKREMIKKDDGSSASQLFSEKNEIIPVGSPYNDMKITPHGQAYYNHTSKPLLKTEITTPNLIKEIDKSQIISVMTGSKCLIQTGQQKHIYPGIFYKGDFYTTGYLTKANYGIKLHEKLFKNFQQEKENKEPNNHLSNTQQVVEFTNIMRIPGSMVTILKYGNEYLKETGASSYLSKRFAKLYEKPYVDYNPNGIVHEDIFRMSMAHDQNVTNKKPHPKTETQLKQEMYGKQKQKELQKNKEINKKETLNNYSKNNDSID